MKGILLSGALAFLFALFATPLAIKLLVKKSYGQFIRDDGPTTHHTKRGTPTMGGTVIIFSVIFAYFISHLLMVMTRPYKDYIMTIAPQLYNNHATIIHQ